jgi:hypothetical protein
MYDSLLAHLYRPCTFRNYNYGHAKCILNLSKILNKEISFKKYYVNVQWFFFNFLMEHHQEHHKENLTLIGDKFLESFPINIKLEINFPLN